MDQLAFRALSDPTRRAILEHLMHGDMTIAEVSGKFEITRAAVKKHLTILKEGGLVSVKPRGRERINSLNPQGFGPVFSWLGHFDQFWDDRLSDLKSAIEKETKHD